MGGLGVEDHRLRHHDRAVAGGGGAPAEVDVVAEDRQLLVEAAELGQEPAAHQHAGGVDREHGPHLVVLALVVLAALEAGLPAAGAGDRHAQLEQPAQGGPLPELGAEHVGVRVLLGGVQQRRERPRVGVGVVVEDPHPAVIGAVVGAVVTAQPVEAGGHRPGERGGAGQLEHLAEGVAQQLGAGVLAAGVDRDHAVRPAWSAP